ncbi:MAG: hypothetical protein HKO04_03670 [Silicimonas sp.]|nr:hypothetical protein [Silicimonas sp.]
MVRIRLDQDEAARLARRRPLLIDAQRKELDAEVAEFRQELMEIHGGDAEADEAGRL